MHLNEALSAKAIMSTFIVYFEKFAKRTQREAFGLGAS